ncbi:MAG: DoxX family protein, partial [Chloroflexota bacterium]
MDTVITVIQVLLGLLVTVGGLAKLALPYAKYSQIPAVAWSKEFKPWHLKLMGVLEVSGGVGLLVPLFLPALTTLTPLAAVGVALYMSGAMATHLRRSEYPYMVGNLMVFLVPALFVAYV